MSDWVELFDSDKVLRVLGVTCFVHRELPGALSTVYFRFEDFGARIGVEPMDDTLTWRRVDGESWVDPAERELPTSAFLAEYIGRVVRWVWLMENHRGYRDGVLLLFGDEPSDLSEYRLLLYAEASQVQVTELAVRRQVSIGSWPFSG